MQTFTPMQYLQIDIANNFGLDKEDWLDRIKWFEQNENQLEALVEQADEPALYHAGVMAYRKAEQGLPIGYPVAFDATASGMQILACLTGDRKAAELCNVVNAGRRMDSYTSIYHKMLDVLGEGAKIKRNDVKQAVMTAFYGSEAIPRQVFGEGSMLLRIFEQVMSEAAPGAWELNKFFLDIWNPDATAYHWVLPDNFHVHTKVMVKEVEVVHFLNKPYETFREVQGTKEKGRSLSANSVHSLDGMVVREIVRRCDYDQTRINEVLAVLRGQMIELPNEDHNVEMTLTLWKHYLDTGYLSARILDHIDTTTLMLVDPNVIWDLIESLPSKPFKVLTVHDCFRVLPNYVTDLRKQYNNQLYLIAKSNILSSILSQIMGKKVNIGKLDPSMINEILKADYALS
ncbi:RNA polymerase [Achromobacter phage vB_AxyP_19-32_Axy11]|uniref:DNA-directed RNA polymerase n=1 Tax=Achromobacter phage vB_AxyP_19-32_Axy11 TaxID=2591042 RepID=A0A514CU63_9CAUD|nr:RNA polymerase [Achromobacter phage vB_AxyP_19-32_Axy11]QDH84011.1 putative RNA polymerase [Achromobacter phage vB_AxyP_19-32_Axy11]